MKKILIISCLISTAVFSWGFIGILRDGLNVATVLSLLCGFNGAVITGLAAYLIHEFGAEKRKMN